MKEELLQYIWNSGLFDMKNLETTGGIPITIVKRGKLNKDSGPDFTEAGIRTPDSEWFGNVEIHISSSSWKKHKHHLDKSYNSTILHVVLENDEPCYREDGSHLPCLELKNRIDRRIEKRYDTLFRNNMTIPCSPFIRQTNPLLLSQTISRMSAERLENKTGKLTEYLQITTGDWNRVVFLALGRAMGFGINSDSMEQLALNIPFRIFMNYAEDFLQRESLVFGMAGFLEGSGTDEYFFSLKKEWQFLKTKYALDAMDRNIFRSMRTRPGNFPAIRIAQFASIGGLSARLFHLMIHSHSPDDLRPAFQIRLPDYWDEHYRFNELSGQHKAALSNDAIDRILINALIPVLFSYGMNTGQDQLCEKALYFLQELPSENNHIIRLWNSIGINSDNALESQALIELKNNFCDAKKCLQCPMAYEILGKS